jgi:hypothetical protein
VLVGVGRGGAKVVLALTSESIARRTLPIFTGFSTQRQRWEDGPKDGSVRMILSVGNLPIPTVRACEQASEQEQDQSKT